MKLLKFSRKPEIQFSEQHSMHVRKRLVICVSILCRARALPFNLITSFNLLYVRLLSIFLHFRFVFCVFDSFLWKLSRPRTHIQNSNMLISVAPSFVVYFLCALNIVSDAALLLLQSIQWLRSFTHFMLSSLFLFFVLLPFSFSPSLSSNRLNMLELVDCVSMDDDFLFVFFECRR